MERGPWHCARHSPHQEGLRRWLGRGSRAVALDPSGVPRLCSWPAGFGATPLGEWRRTHELPRLSPPRARLLPRAGLRAQQTQGRLTLPFPVLSWARLPSLPARPFPSGLLLS